MRNMSRWTLVVTGFMLTACSSTEWVHPNKPSSEYVNDYNQCEKDAALDPKLMQGNKLLLMQSAERCVQKKGWRLVEKDQ